MLFSQLDKLKRSIIMTSIILMFIGNILLLIPESFIPFLSTVVGFVLLTSAAVIVLDFIGSKKVLIDYIHLSLGLLLGLIGAIIYAFDDFFVQMLSWLVGTVPILSGIHSLYHALAFARHSGRKGWWVLIILSCLLMAFGSVIFINPWTETLSATVQVMGGTMMFSSIVSLLQLIWIWPVHSEGE